MKILGIYDHSGPKYHRILLPLMLSGFEYRLVGRITEDDVKDIDILFFNRHVPGVSPLTVLAWRNKYNFSIVVDFDDHWHLGQDHYLYEQYLVSGISEVMKLWIKESDAVFVTHERLFHEAFTINQNTHILPNAIPEFDQFLCKKVPSDFTRLFWAGGVTHEKDIELLRYPIRELRSLPIQMVMGGFNKTKIYHKMRNDFTNYGKLNNELIESLPVERYYYTYSKCDISLIPLTETKFNSHKSNLKILEAANIAAPVIVSRVHPYLGFPEDLVNYVDSPSDWCKQVRKLLDAPGQAIYQGEKLREYCRENYNFEKINGLRKQIFNETRKQKSLREVPALSYGPGV